MSTSTYTRRKAEGRCPRCAVRVSDGYIYCLACRRLPLPPMVRLPEPLYSPEHPHPATRWWWCLGCQQPILVEPHTCADTSAEGG